MWIIYRKVVTRGNQSFYFGKTIEEWLIALTTDQYAHGRFMFDDDQLSCLNEFNNFQTSCNIHECV